MGQAGVVGRGGADRALANIPPEQLRMHVCWGNYEGPHHRDVALADIASDPLSDAVRVLDEIGL